VEIVDEFLTDEQQADVVRKWIRENGGYMLGGLVIGLGGLFGWNQWQDYREVQAEQASELYEEIVLSMRDSRGTRADALLLDLQKDHSSSPYLDQARLMMAKFYLDRSEFELASNALADVVSGSRSSEMKHIARLRLARVRIQQQKLNEALDILTDTHPGSAFSARYHDLRGDIFHALNRPDDARSEYVAALSDVQQPPVVDRMYVQTKLDDLGVQSVSGPDAALREIESVDAASADQRIDIEPDSKD
jgi:predicted negative regulator of RcsB-dependent stress response